jgi:hypothetical protein
MSNEVSTSVFRGIERREIDAKLFERAHVIATELSVIEEVRKLEEEVRRSHNDAVLIQPETFFAGEPFGQPFGGFNDEWATALLWSFDYGFPPYEPAGERLRGETLFAKCIKVAIKPSMDPNNSLEDRIFVVGARNAAISLERSNADSWDKEHLAKTLRWAMENPGILLDCEYKKVTQLG